MGIVLTSTDGHGIVSSDGKSITCTSPDILSSVAGSYTCGFHLANTGTIDAHVSVAVAGPAAPFASLLAASGPTAMGSAGLTYAGGLSWPELANAQEGVTYTVTYTITATA